MKRIAINSAILFCLAFSVKAQTVQVTAAFDSLAMFIGDQTCLRIEVAFTGERQLRFPLFKDSVPAGLELVETLGYDTMHETDGTVKIAAKYIFTGWDSALVYVDGFPVVDGEDTFVSNAVSLKIVDIDVDTANAICDIKPVYDPPFDWELIWTIVILVVLAAALVVAGIFVYRKYFRNKKKADEEVKVFDSRPADVIALEQLEQLRQEKLWQEGRNKEYYSVLTDIIKSYINRRYGINAVESTTDDLLRELRMNTRISIDKEPIDVLKEVLGLADLVKFAKWNPLPTENERAFEDGKNFVQNTRKTEEEKK
ncbi:MAG: hypothetical protein MJ002_01545 [Paludibacteraceae bacterium]|nr:hypothetical protein [Paludibacteraceae bacterium]